MSYEKPKKLSEIYADGKGEKEFAEKVLSIVHENYEEYEPYREKCTKNESVWRGRHWNDKPFQDETDESRPRPNVPVLHSTVENCKADIIDNRPGQVIRGVGNDDDLKALIVTELLRFTYQRAKYNKKFKKKISGMLKRGEGTIQVYWNPELMNGMGDVDFRYLHVKNMVWAKGADDINDGRFFAFYDWVQPEELYEYYPDLDLNDAMPETDAQKEESEEVRDIENIRMTDEDGNVKVITYMWKEREPRMVNGVKMGHITYINTAVVCGRTVLDYKEKQYEYDRFFVNTLADVELEGEPVGLSEIDMHIDDADTVNLIQKLWLCNLQASAEDRFLVNRTAGINEKDILNFNKKVIMGNAIHQGAITPFKPTPFNAQALNMQNNIVAGIKERSGQTDFNIGQGAGGVTSGYGIERMQQYGAKRSRLRLDNVYDDHQNTSKDVLKLIQTHYNTERIVRLSREAQDEIQDRLKKAMEALQQMEQPEGTDVREAAAAVALPKGVTLNANGELAIDFSIFRLDNLDLDYDIEIIPQRHNMVTSDAINAFVNQLVNSKAIDGQTAVELSEFEGKERMMKTVRKYNDINARMQQMAQQAQQATEQAEQYAQIAEKQAKEIEKNKAKIVDLTIRLGLERLDVEDEGEEQPKPQNAEEAYQQIQAEIEANVEA